MRKLAATLLALLMLVAPAEAYRRADLGPRPSAWCGWFMRTLFGGGPQYNLARNWARRGRPVSPQIGAVVVWPHHVGKIVGRAPAGAWIVLSGNDGHAVRERPRSLARVIAVRML